MEFLSMENQATNPLTKYYRQPAIYLKLPSSGRWWGEESIQLPANGEIGVMPMTVRDEITLRTPDALMNGQGVVEVIQSCCPAIRNAWLMPSIDVDAVLIAIRIATYGSIMPFSSQCPHCKEKNEHDLNLGQQLDHLQNNLLDFNHHIHYKDLKIKLKPQQYFQVNQGNQVNFEEQKILEALGREDLDAEIKSQQIQASMNRIVDLGIKSCAYSTDYIETGDGERVRDQAVIEDFYKNAENEVVKSIQARLSELLAQSQLPKLHLQCGECREEYDVGMTFDYANFFAKGF